DLVEEAEDRLLAEDRRQGGAAEVELAARVPELDPPVLREAPLGDVEVRHDLEARQDRRLEALGWGEHLVQDAVHPDAYPEHLFVRLEVSVRATLLAPVGDHHVPELD